MKKKYLVPAAAAAAALVLLAAALCTAAGVLPLDTALAPAAGTLLALAALAGQRASNSRPGGQAAGSLRGRLLLLLLLAALGGGAALCVLLFTGTAAQALTALLQERASDIYARKEAELGEPLMRELERVMMLRVVDEYWMDNIDAMQELRQGIGLRAYGQNDPVVAYKKEGYEMFESMIAAIQAETIRRIFLARVQVGATTVKRERVAKVTGESAGSDGTVKKQPVKKGQKVGRNDPCPCGSGKKYKKCCGMHEDE